jgi:AhpD family alkylhydroperoxidase
MSIQTDNRIEARVDLSGAVPDLYRAMLRLDGAVAKTSLDKDLLNLIQLRASQINRCVYCIDLHTTDARAAGESDQRLHAVGAWAEAPYYTERERMALALTEHITLLSDRGVPDELWEQAGEHFSAEERAELVFAATAINAWNRLAVTTRMVPGT